MPLSWVDRRLLEATRTILDPVGVHIAPQSNSQRQRKRAGVWLPIFRIRICRLIDDKHESDIIRRKL